MYKNDYVWLIFIKTCENLYSIKQINSGYEKCQIQKEVNASTPLKGKKMKEPISNPSLECAQRWNANIKKKVLRRLVT